MSRAAHRLPLTTLLLALCACGAEGRLGPINSAGEPQADIPIVVPPTLTLHQPARGAWLEPDADSVRFEGSIVAGSAPLSEVSLGDSPLALGPGGDFSSSVPASPGINIVGVRAGAPDGGRAVDVRSFFAGDTVAPGEIIPTAIRVALAPGLIDDDDQRVDDLARLFEIIASGMEISPELLEPIDFGSSTATPVGFSFADPSVDLVPDTGLLTLGTTLHDVHLPFHLEGDFGALGYIDSAAEMRAYSVTTQIELHPRIEGGRLILGATQVATSFVNFSIMIATFGNDSSVADLIGEALLSSVESRLEERILTALASIEERLAERSMTTIELFDGALALQIELRDLQLSPEGIVVDIGAGVAATQPKAELVSTARGSLKTPGGPTTPRLGDHQMAVVIDDDLVNQFLFAIWYSGAFHDVTISAADMGDQAAALPEVFQPIREIALNLLLPPVVTARDGADDLFFDLSLGSLEMLFQTETQRRIRSFIGMRFPMGAQGQDGSLVPKVDGRSSNVFARSGCVEAPDGVSPSGVAALLSLMVAPMLRSFPVEPRQMPDVSLGELVERPALADWLLTWEGLALGALDGSSGYLVFDGEPSFEQRTPSSVPASPDLRSFP